MSGGGLGRRRREEVPRVGFIAWKARLAKDRAKKGVFICLARGGGGLRMGMEDENPGEYQLKMASFIELETNLARTGEERKYCNG